MGRIRLFSGINPDPLHALPLPSTWEGVGQAGKRVSLRVALSLPFLATSTPEPPPLSPSLSSRRQHQGHPVHRRVCLLKTPIKVLIVGVSHS